MKLPALSAERLTGGQSLAEAMAQIIRAEISSGRLGEGERLPQELELVKHFGISRPTCREALRILQSEGLLLVSRGNGGGPRINTPDPRKIASYAAMTLRMRKATLHDTLEIRRLIEPTVIARLALNPVNEVISSLAQVAVAQRYALPDAAAFLKYELEFRRILLENCDSEPLRLFGLMLDELISDQLRTLSERMPDHPHRVSESEYCVKLKIKVLDLISAGKADEARAEWEQYMVDYEKGVLRHGGAGLLL